MSTGEGDDGGAPQAARIPSSYFREKPVKIGEELDVTVTELSRRGDGVTRIQGYVIFIPNAKQGQQARVRITAIRPNYAIAEVVSTDGGASRA